MKFKKIFAVLLIFAILVPASFVHAQDNSEKINALLEEIEELEKEAEDKRKEVKELSFGQYTDGIDYVTIDEDVTDKYDIDELKVTLVQLGVDYSSDDPILNAVYNVKNISRNNIEFYAMRSGATQRLDVEFEGENEWVWPTQEYVIMDGYNFIQELKEPEYATPNQEMFFRIKYTLDNPIGVYYLTGNYSDYWKIPIHNTPEPFGEFIRQ